ncbi:acetoin utilization deacetylase AcuC-like enzyme [Hoeflea halophila]|uniref:Acetoin utilization deacetylase AcuC-like enzyme n=2 Tax=Hoeflea halophila TaxID=714899 RepID=A0A286IDB3_9HYPH|nr:acetoin utilization deacetylase AcuC-like enzyme [Hoeflea halophila]
MDACSLAGHKRPMSFLPIVHAPDYDANFAPDHRFPMGKYTRLMELIRASHIGERTIVHAPGPASAEWLSLAHHRVYVDQVLACKVPAFIEREIGFPVTERVSLRARLATAGTVMAARLALAEGIACNTAGGSHHARRAQGAGFCTFNDVAVAAHLLLADGEVGQVLVIDLDVHQGDGTAEICAGTDAIRTVSMHSEKNYPVRKQASSIDVALPDGVRDAAYLETLDWLLPRSVAGFTPDLVFYNAGVDPHENDRLGRLSLSDRGLKDRDRRVFSFFRERGIAVASVLGGGYSRDIEAVAGRHLMTFEAAAEFA